MNAHQDPQTSTLVISGSIEIHPDDSYIESIEEATIQAHLADEITSST